jgi:hypothetical protein
MVLAPRVVLVHRRTELDDLLGRHGTRGQAEFFLAGRGRTIGEVAEGDIALRRAIQTVTASIPMDWRRGRVERADLPRFLFAPDDVIVVVGQDGLVANVSKYLDGQPVIGIDPQPGRNAGVLVRHPAGAAGGLLRLIAGRRLDDHIETRTMLLAVTDDGQRLLALNEIYVGQPGHQTARYWLRLADGAGEHQASSGVVVSTGTGATGWCRSLWLERRSDLELPGPTEQRLLWFVREAWPSPVTGTTLTEGSLAATELTLEVESDSLVAFGDGIESDRLELSRGQLIRIGAAARRLRLVG